MAIFMQCILELVKSVLKNAESEEHPDHNHHQYQARAQHANLPPAAHLRRLSVYFSPEKLRWWVYSELNYRKNLDLGIGLWANWRVKRNWSFVCIYIWSSWIGVVGKRDEKGNDECGIRLVTFMVSHWFSKRLLYAFF